jgi:hypothetical protein
LEIVLALRWKICGISDGVTDGLSLRGQSRLVPQL